MTLITRVADVMQEVFSPIANHLAKTSGLIKRTRKLTGEKFAQLLVFSWLSNPQASLQDMSQTAATLGVKISPQAIEKRFTQESCQFLYDLLTFAVCQVIETEQTATDLFSRFSSVIVADSTTITLPDALHEVWAGCGGKNEKNTQAAVKLQACLDLSRGRIAFSCHHGKASDNKAPIQQSSLPAACLKLGDLGYFNLTVFSRLSADGSFWLSRLKLSTHLFSPQAEPIEIGKFLSIARHQSIDLNVLLGKKRKLPARLIAHRVSDEIANQRRRKIRADAKRKGRLPSKARLAVADFTILVTNASANLLAADEALTLMRIRWQIEQVFKLWKSINHIDKSQSEKTWRILSEVYGKLIVVLVQHWLIVMGVWQIQRRSFTKAAKTIARYAMTLAIAFASKDFSRLIEILVLLTDCLSHGCRVERRNKAPSAFQLLETEASKKPPSDWEQANGNRQLFP